MADQQSAFNRELQRYLARGAVEAQSAAATNQYAMERAAQRAAEEAAKKAAAEAEEEASGDEGFSLADLAAARQDPENVKKRIEEKYGEGSAVATTKKGIHGTEYTSYISPASRKARQEAAKQQYTPEQLAEMESLGESPTAMSRRSVVARAKERRAQQKAAPTPAAVTPPAQADTSSFAFKPGTGVGMTETSTYTGQK